MPVGTKHRQQQTAELCKEHLRQKNASKLGLVEEYISEFEGSGKNHDITRWCQFSDMKDMKEEMLRRLDVAFDQWLNP